MIQDVEFNKTIKLNIDKKSVLIYYLHLSDQETQTLSLGWKACTAGDSILSLDVKILYY